MNENFTSLIFFTILSQTATGALIFRELILFRGGFEFISDHFRRKSILIITFLLFLSLTISFLHLGKPIHALNAINNLGNSWLSREIFSLSLLMTSLAVYMILVIRNNYKRTEKTISAISMVLAISFLFSMIKLYMIPSVISWNNPFTPISFIITTFLCGVVLLTVIIGKNIDNINLITAPLIAIFIISSLANSIFFSGTFINQSFYLFIIRAALSMTSLGIVASLKFRMQSNKTSFRRVILFMMVLSSEIINRYIFFLSFEKSGL
jgi:anaerobic dimethyl sulfoxide reductase subunit C (anchor subunit)